MHHLLNYYIQHSFTFESFNKPTTPVIIRGCDALFGAMNFRCSALFSEILSSLEDSGQTNITKYLKMLGMLCS